MAEQSSTWNWLNILGIASGVASIFGLPYAYILYRRGERKKMLVYEISPPMAFAEVMKTPGQQLTLLYEKPGDEPKKIQGAYVHFVQLANFGKEPIRRQDLTDQDPLRIEVLGTKVLDVARVKVTRGLDFSLEPMEEHPRGKSISRITFEFLDENDGALIQIVTEKPGVRIQVAGKIIGMPHGVMCAEALDKSGVMVPIGCGLGIVLQLATVIGAAYLFVQVTGGWDLWWILVLPLATFLIPAIVTSLLLAALSPKGVQWASDIERPSWFRRALHATMLYERNYKRRDGVLRRDPARLTSDEFKELTPPERHGDRNETTSMVSPNDPTHQ